MNQLVSILAFVIWSAGLASGGQFESTNKELNLDGLDAWLLRRFGRYSSELVREKSIDAENRTAEILGQLRRAETCNDELIRTLVTALNFLLPKMYIHDQVDARVKYDVIKVFELCDPYIDQQLKARLSSADKKMKAFLWATRPYYTTRTKTYPSELVWVFDMFNTRRNYIYCVSEDYRLPRHDPLKESQEINYDRLGDLLLSLVKGGGESTSYFLGPDNEKVNIPNFEAAFKKYLVEPCKQFEVHFGPLFHGVNVIASITDMFKYVERRDGQFRQLAYTDKICQAVLITDGDRIRNAWREWGYYNAKEDILRRVIAMW